MEQGPHGHQPAKRWLAARIDRKGLRPRFAAYLIAGIWLVAVIAFGIAEHLVDRDTFPTVWLGMWWALQTVTTVGYGDVVPAQPSGKIIATFLMLGGLSLLAVVTGVVTSGFVARAQAEQRASGDDPLMHKLDELGQAMAAVQRELAELRGGGKRPSSSD